MIGDFIIVILKHLQTNQQDTSGLKLLLQSTISSETQSNSLRSILSTVQISKTDRKSLKSY